MNAYIDNLLQGKLYEVQDASGEIVYTTDFRIDAIDRVMRYPGGEVYEYNMKTGEAYIIYENYEV